MKPLFVVLCTASLLIASPAIAKKQKQHQGGARGSGAYCWSGADSVFIPGARFSEKVRNKLRKGEVIKIRISGYGPVNCKIY